MYTEEENLRRRILSLRLFAAVAQKALENAVEKSKRKINDGRRIVPERTFGHAWKTGNESADFLVNVWDEVPIKNQKALIESLLKFQ